jgi:hypothetical protein
MSAPSLLSAVEVLPAGRWLTVAQVTQSLSLADCPVTNFTALVRAGRRRGLLVTDPRTGLILRILRRA